ncbi:MAG: NAD(P)-binding domain-containing protein [Burkholderiaceae bacterium]
MTTIGLIGSGHIGGTVARLAVDAGHDVVLSNSRGPDTLTDLVAQLGPRAGRRLARAHDVRVRQHVAVRREQEAGAAAQAGIRAARAAQADRGHAGPDPLHHLADRARVGVLQEGIVGTHGNLLRARRWVAAARNSRAAARLTLAL